MAVTCANGHSNLDGMAFCEECGIELTALTDRPAVVATDFGGSAPATQPGGTIPEGNSSVSATPDENENAYNPNTCCGISSYGRSDK